MELKRMAALALAGTLLLGTGCGKEEETAEQPVPAGTAVEVIEAAQGPMSASYTVTGKVAAVDEVQVFPLLAGQVMTLSVAEGDRVSRGQTLLTVDTSTVTATRGALQQSYDATKTATDRAIESARIGVAQAQQAVDNVEALFEAGAAAEQDVTKARQGLAQAQAGVAQVEAQQAASLAQIRASMDQIDTQVGLGTVTAPCAGTVTMVNVVRGGMASSAQPAVVIAADSRVEVQAAVAEDVYAVLHEGDEAGVQIAVLSDAVLRGTIASLPAAANRQTSLYDIAVALPDDVQPPIGTFATVTLYTDRRTDTIAVPTEAILTGADEEQYLFVVESGDAGENAKRITVETGLVSKTDTEIVSGLSVGDRVVVKGQSYLSDGAAVRVVSGQDAPTADAAAGEEG